MLKKNISVLGAYANVGVKDTIAFWFLKRISLIETKTPLEIIKQKHFERFGEVATTEISIGDPISGLN